jgi:hypothetical protein
MWFVGTVCSIKVHNDELEKNSENSKFFRKLYYVVGVYTPQSKYFIFVVYRVLHPPCYNFCAMFGNLNYFQALQKDGV